MELGTMATKLRILGVVVLPPRHGLFSRAQMSFESHCTGKA